MGCTSSAPNSIASPTSATGKTLQFSEETKEQSPETMSTNVKTEDNPVLPDCDKLDDREQLAKNNNSILDINKMDPQQTECEPTEHEETPEEMDDNHIETTVYVEEKLSTLEEVVEKVVEILSERNSQSGSFNDLKIMERTATDLAEINKDKLSVLIDKQNQEDITDATKTKDGNNENVSEPTSPTHESVSPSHSTSSRVTRWEALADIAAELPPSLAVDPVTGQIFSLTK